MSEKAETATLNSIDNKSLTLVTTAFVAAANLIPDNTWRKVGALSAPAMTIGIAYLFKKARNIIYNGIEQYRAVKAYNYVLGNLNKKLDGCTGVKERTTIKKEIDKYEKDLHDLKIRNIKSFI